MYAEPSQTNSPSPYFKIFDTFNEKGLLIIKFILLQVISQSTLLYPRNDVFLALKGFCHLKINIYLKKIFEKQ